MQFLLCCSAVSIVVELTHLHLFINFSFMQETSHNVEAAVDCGVNDPSTDKCKVIFIFIVFIHISLIFMRTNVPCLFIFLSPIVKSLQVIPTFFVTVV